jgi:hypothetical protein
MHQELGWERQTERTGMTVMVFADRIENPVLEASGHFSTNGAGSQRPVAGQYCLTRPAD